MVYRSFDPEHPGNARWSQTRRYEPQHQEILKKMSKLSEYCKDKARLNLIIDGVLLLLLLAMAGIGFLIKYVLLPGVQRNLRYGSDVDLVFAGMDRHQWGTVHLIISLLFVSLVILHIILHWKLVVSLFRRMVPGRGARIAVVVLLLISFMVLAAFPLVVNPVKVPHEPLHHGRTDHGRPEEPQGMRGRDFRTPAGNEGISGSEIGPAGGHGHSVSGEGKADGHPAAADTFEVTGSQTLREVALRYGVPAEALCRDLNIPEESADIRLGHLRKRHGFTMTDVRVSLQSRLEKQNADSAPDSGEPDR